MPTPVTVLSYFNLWQSNYSEHVNFNDTRTYFRKLITSMAIATGCDYHHPRHNYNFHSVLTNKAWGRFNVYISYEHLIDNSGRIKIVIGGYNLVECVNIHAPWISSSPNNPKVDIVWMFLQAKISENSILITNLDCNEGTPINIELDGDMEVNLEQIQPLCAIIANAITVITNVITANINLSR